MARLADIFKRMGKGIREPKVEKPPGMGREKSEVRLSLREREKYIKKSEDQYQKAILFMKGVWADLSKGKAINIKAVKEVVTQLLNDLIATPELMINLSRHYVSDTYLPIHSVNVCLCSLSIGLAFGYERSWLINLGMGALLHDVGMIRVPEEIFLRQRKLTPQDWTKIKEHPIHGKEMLKSAEEMNEHILAAVTQQHERMMGQGYPEGLKGEEIHRFAKIVGLVDAYEAITHPRIYKESKSPHEAIKELMGLNGTHFASHVVKTLIDELTFYPVGSIVQLSNQETGRVIAIRKGLPTRPMVEIILDRRSRAIREPKVIDLSQQNLLFIRKVLTEEELHQILNHPGH